MISTSVKLTVLDLMINQKVNHRPQMTWATKLQKKQIENAGGIKKVCKELNIPSKLELDQVIERGKSKFAEREEQRYLARVKESHKNDIY